MKEKTLQIITKELNRKYEIKETDSLINGLNVNSLERTVVTWELEKEFNIVIQSEEAESWYNIQDIYNTVINKAKS